MVRKRDKFMALLKKLTNATQKVVRGAKDFTDTARQNSLIEEEKKQVENIYLQIGKLYFESTETDEDTSIGRLCYSVKESNKRIAKYNEEIRQIKGTKQCPSCGAEISLTSTFCGICGDEISIFTDTGIHVGSAKDSKKYCTNCGGMLKMEAFFCTSCGQKQ